jgi:methylenetetrahydrofolate reductase (NADPH)
MRISVELVPRDEGTLLRDAVLLRDRFPCVGQLNIPDLLRFPIRSWEACRITHGHFPVSIPHVRAMDMPGDGALCEVEQILGRGFSEVLVVSGDQPQGDARRLDATNAVTVIRRLKREWPGLKVYAAYDPYRQGLRAECEYAAQKLDAGADGFFTQPFFDLRLLELHAELLLGHNVFWGITPVTTETSRAYWAESNRVIFPRDFAPTLAWNQSFACGALELVRGAGGNVYFMPIRVDLERYLTGIL